MISCIILGIVPKSMLLLFSMCGTLSLNATACVRITHVLLYICSCVCRILQTGFTTERASARRFYWSLRFLRACLLIGQRVALLRANRCSKSRAMEGDDATMLHAHANTIEPTRTIVGIALLCEGEFVCQNKWSHRLHAHACVCVK